ncbi:MAG: hypothetical protein OEZ34_12090 [Spirochaetia bacterium]|nr:hypothetical protein [Spirochaetia bacterium]
MSWFEDIIQEKRVRLKKRIAPICKDVAEHCARAWPDQKKLKHELERGLRKLPLCTFISAVNLNYEMTGPIFQRSKEKNEKYKLIPPEQNLFLKIDSSEDFSISDVYVNHITNNPSLAVQQSIYKKKEKIGYLLILYELKNLKLSGKAEEDSFEHVQIKGDPAIRATVFEQQKAMSQLDEHIDDVLIIMNELICYHGVFHSKIHFSSSRATLWLMEDPYVYKIHMVNEIMDPAIALAYPKRPYPKRSVVKPDDIMKVLKLFKELRNADETIYLRSGSINIINGMLGLTFSCDGSHYMSVENFLSRGLDFWFGPGQNQ